jgi:transcriptional regulator NrdR family protein
MGKKRRRRQGIPCPHCSCPFSKVLTTTPRPPIIKRLHSCHGCGKSFDTTEAVPRMHTDVAHLTAVAKSLVEELNRNPLTRRA